MSIKRIFIVISAIFAVSAVFADNSSVTSKKYVDDLMSGYQGKLPGSGANTLMIYDNSEDGIGEKSIAATLGNSASAVSVPTVGAVKTGLDGKQDTITGTAGYVMTGTGTPGEVGERAIYSANTNYTDSLVTAETVNSGVINAVNSSLIRVGTDGQPNENGILWEINTDLLALDVRGYLPDGYTQLQYIESNGTQYIDTGYKPNTNTTIKTKMYMTANANTPFGCRWSGAPEYDTFGAIVGGTGQLTIYYGRYSDGKYTPYLSYNKSIVHDIEINMDSVVYDGSTIPITRGSFASTENMYLGAFNNLGEAQNLITGRIYSVEIKESNIMVRNLVPAKHDSDSKIGMYDVINDVFYPDAAGGNFTAGPTCVSPNLFDGDVLKGNYSGIYTTDTTVSKLTNKNPIQITPGETYTFGFMGAVPSWFTRNDRLNWVIYDSAGSVVVAHDTTVDSQTALPITFTAPANAKWLRFSTFGSEVSSQNYAEQLANNIMFVIGNSLPQEYRPYGENICD